MIEASIASAVPLAKVVEYDLIRSRKLSSVSTSLPSLKTEVLKAIAPVKGTVVKFVIVLMPALLLEPASKETMLIPDTVSSPAGMTASLSVLNSILGF